MPDAEIDAIRRILTSQPRPTGLAERRQRLDALGSRYAVAQDVTVEPVNANGVAAEWTTVPGSASDRVLMFLHGGGYISGSITSHRHMIAEAGRQAGVRSFAVGYRLAPEHPFPAALDDALTAYRFLLSSGIAAENIILAGESAGGGLAVATATRLRDAGDKLPACLWCASPWVDLEMTGRSMDSKASVDPLIQRGYLTELAADYLNGADPAGPMASPLHADLHGLPPMLIQVGSAETLLDDAIRLAGAAGSADVDVRLEVWPDMIHAWHLFYQQVAAGRRSLASVGAYICQHLR